VAATLFLRVPRVDHHTTTIQRLLHTVVVHQSIRLTPIPDSHADAVTIRNVRSYVGINRGYDEPITSAAIDRSDSLELGAGGTIHHQPLIVRTKEIQVSSCESKLRFTTRGSRTLGIFGHKAELTASGQRKVACVSARR